VRSLESKLQRSPLQREEEDAPGHLKPTTMAAEGGGSGDSPHRQKSRENKYSQEAEGAHSSELPPATSAGQEQHARRATRRSPSPPRHLGRPGEEERRISPPSRSTGEHSLIQGELAPDTHTAIGSHHESTAARWQEATPPDLTGEIWGHPPARSATYRHSGQLLLRET
jgi:hypothetical protein